MSAITAQSGEAREFVQTHPLLAALVEHERVRTQGYAVLTGHVPQLRQLFAMCGVETRYRIIGITMEHSGATVKTETVAPEWAVSLGGLVTGLMGSSLWQKTFDGHKLVLLFRKARRDKELRKELLAVPRLVGDDQAARDSLRSVLDDIVAKHLRGEV